MYFQIKYLIIDVDGTMTDASIYYDEDGNEIKKFCTRDGVGFLAAKRAGIQLIVMTGRKCKSTERRMKELGVDYIFQGTQNKREFLENFMREKDISKAEVGYIGDDINDYPAMLLAGFIGCPEDSCELVKSKADYVSKVKGGRGAVRDVIEVLLKERGQWDSVIEQLYGSSECGV